MTPNCAAIESELSSWLDGELAADAAARVEAHVRQCPACAAEVAALQRVGHVLRRWDADESRSAPSYGFRNRVLARLGLAADVLGPAADRAVAPSGRPAPEVRWAWLRTGATAAAAAGVAALATYAALRPAPSVPAPDVAALRREIAATVRSEIERARIVDAPAPGVTAASAPPRTAPYEPVVGRPAEGDGAPFGPPEPEERWEVLGDGAILRDARPAYDAYDAERRRLYFEERLARVESSHRSAGGATTSAGPALTPVAAFLAATSVSDVAFPPFERLQVWPIEVASPPPPGVRPLTADDAFRSSALTVREDAEGVVVATNADPRSRPVLLLAGDVLRGGRRDRVVREELFIAAGQSVVVPTFGSGRARERTSHRNFFRSGLVAPTDLRAIVGVALLGGPVGQGDVDEVVRSSVIGFGSNGTDGSLDNLWVNVELQAEVGRIVGAFRSRLERPNVVGFAVAVGPRLLALEVCGDAETFRAVRDRALQSHVLYALSRSSDEVAGPPPEASAVTALLERASRAVYDLPATSGEGTISVFRSAQDQDGVFGHGLVARGRVVHAVAYAGVPAGEAAAVAGRGRAGRVRLGDGGRLGGPGASPTGPTRGGDEGGRGLQDR